MIPRATLPGTELGLSRFVFGTASLHRIRSESARRALLDAAADAGFTHFDTAPLYGFGFAERALAPLLKRNPDIGVTTKVGLYAPGGEDQGRMTALARKAAGKMLPALSRARADWSVLRARESLEASLRRIARDHVDLLLLHEPDAAVIATDEWLRFLENECRARVRVFGIAGTADRLAPFVETGSPLAHIVQTADSIDRREADFLAAAGRPLQLTYGYLSAVRPTNADQARVLLIAALRRNATGAVVVTTRQSKRLGEFVAAGAAA